MGREGFLAAAAEAPLVDTEGEGWANLNLGSR